MLELEDVVQCEVTRKRWRFLAHLPSTATFKLAEVGAGEERMVSKGQEDAALFW